MPPKSNQYCCVYGCKSLYGSQAGISLHGFPVAGKSRVEWTSASGSVSLIDRKKAWMIALKSVPERVTKWSKVCSLHFSSKHFFPSGIPRKAAGLKRDAVPDQVLPECPRPEALRKKLVKRSFRTLQHHHEQSEVAKEGTILSNMQYNCIMSEGNPPINKRICSVPQCSQKTAPGISFHRFPNDPQKKKIWAVALKIGKPVSKYMVVCSRHFQRIDYILPGIATKRPSLKKNAVPSQNLPRGSVRPKRSQQERARIAARGSPSQQLCLPPDEGEVAVAEYPTLDAAGALIELRKALEREAVIHGRRDAGVQVTPSHTDTEKVTISNILRTDKQLRTFTGVCTDRFNKILSKIESIEAGEGKSYAISCRNRLLLCLIKLKLNWSFFYISVLFGVTPDHCRKYFEDMIERLGNLMRCVIRFPSMSEIEQNVPSCFKKYKKTRMVLDCIEVNIKKAECLKCRISTHKGCPTMKTLIGTAPSGLITYVSPCFAGRTCDKAIFIKSKLVEKIAAGEAIMVKDGFQIEAECLEKGISVIRPPSITDRQKMTAKDADETASITAARVHVELAIQRLKIFEILRTDLSYDILPYCDSIMTAIVGLCNLSSHNKFRT